MKCKVDASLGKSLKYIANSRDTPLKIKARMEMCRLKQEKKSKDSLDGGNLLIGSFEKWQ